MNSRAKLIATIASEKRVTKREASRQLLWFSQTLKNHLLEEGDVVLPGIGRLKVQIRPARAGRNPRTGAAIQIAKKGIVKFKISSKLFPPEA